MMSELLIVHATMPVGAVGASSITVVKARSGNISASTFFIYCILYMYSSLSSPLDLSKRLTLHCLADLFIPNPIRLLSHAAITVQSLFTHISTAVCRHHSKEILQEAKLRLRRIRNRNVQQSVNEAYTLVHTDTRKNKKRSNEKCHHLGKAHVKPINTFPMKKRSNEKCYHLGKGTRKASKYFPHEEKTVMVWSCFM